MTESNLAPINCNIIEAQYLTKDLPPLEAPVGENTAEVRAAPWPSLPQDLIISLPPSHQDGVSLAPLSDTRQIPCGGCPAAFPQWKVGFRCS